MGVTACCRLMGLLLGLALLGLAGCDGEGLDALKNSVGAGDQVTPDGGSSGGGSGGGTSTDSRFAGTWIAAFGDDYATTLTSRGVLQYAMQLNLTQQNGSLGGTGRMWRMFRVGDVASDTTGVPLSITGSASTDDAVLTLSSGTSAAFTFNPRWYLRLSGSRMIGMYVEQRSDGAIARAGHAAWYKVGSGAIDGSWLSGHRDVFAATGIALQDRTANVALAQDGSSGLTGDGAFVAQADGNVIANNFEVVRGNVALPFAGFTFGGLDLVNNEMDWFTLLGGSIVVGAYSQYDQDKLLIRNGHATWYRAASDPQPDDVSRRWVTAFGDSVVAGGRLTPYLASMTLTAHEGGGVTGTGTVRDENSGVQDTYSVDTGSIVGTDLHVELTNGARRFVWDLQVTDTALVGSYRQVTTGGAFVSRGIAEWRPSANGTLSGSWAASYFDLNAVGDRNTQFTLATVSRVESDDSLVGTGALRFPGESLRRVFNLGGSVASNRVDWVWQSSSLFGNVEWHLYRAGERLFGTYTNYDSTGSAESRGHAMWLRVSRTDQFSQ